MSAVTTCSKVKVIATLRLLAIMNGARLSQAWTIVNWRTSQTWRVCDFYFELLIISNALQAQSSYVQRSGGLSASAWCSGFGGSKLACLEGGAKSILISGGLI